MATLTGAMTLSVYVTLHDSWISIGPYKVCAPISSILVKPHDMNSLTYWMPFAPWPTHYTVHNIHDHIYTASVKNTFFFLLFVCQYGLPHTV